MRHGRALAGLLGGLLLAGAAGASPAYAEWFSAGDLTNPLAGTVCADSGPFLASASRGWKITVTATAVTSVDFQWRDAANAITKRNVPFKLAARAPLDWDSAGWAVNAVAAERFRLVVLNDVTGTVSCTLFAEP